MHSFSWSTTGSLSSRKERNEDQYLESANHCRWVIDYDKIQIIRQVSQPSRQLPVLSTLGLDNFFVTRTFFFQISINMYI